MSISYLYIKNSINKIEFTYHIIYPLKLCCRWFSYIQSCQIFKMLAIEAHWLPPLAQGSHEYTMPP